MRDGPPTMAASASFSTSTLLKEITCLRAQLKELEEDSKSTVSSAVTCDNMVGGESEAMIQLRKDLSLVVHEKANLEKEFMNQIASLARDNRAIVSELQDKLIRAEARNVSIEGQLGQQGKDDADTHRWMKILEEERDRHQDELEQMKVTLQSSDLEIAECRRELDDMAEQLEDVHAEKDELLREVTDVRLQFSEEQRRTESLRVELKECNNTISKLRQEVAEKDELILEKDNAIATKDQEMGEMNDSIIDLESHKEMLVAEVGDLKQQLEKIKNTKKSKSHLDEALSSSEKETLTNGVQMLEERLAKFQTKLTDRDATITKLSACLDEERLCNQKLKEEIKKVTEASNEHDKVSPVSPSKPPSGRTSPTCIVTSPGCKSPSETETVGPRTPVSTIVASFERRNSKDSPDTSSPKFDDEHGQGTETILDTGPASLQHLNSQLNQEKEANRAMRLQFSQTKDALQKKLTASLTEIQRLQVQLNESQTLRQAVVDDLTQQLALEKESATLLRSDLQQALRQVGDAEQALKEVERLKSQLQECDEFQVSQEQNVMELEKELLEEKEKSHELHIKLDETEEQYSKSVTEMGNQLFREQEQVQLLMIKVEAQEAEHRKEAKDIEDRLSRERALVSKLRSDLDNAGQSKSSPSNMEMQLKESQREINQLRFQLAALEKSNEAIKTDTAEIAKLRMKAHQAHSEKRQLENKVTLQEQEVDRLKSELSYCLVSGSMQEEKKESHGCDEGDEVSRLRSQVHSLQEELSAAMTEIERLLDEVESLRNALRTEPRVSRTSEQALSPKSQRSYEAQINKLQVELTKTQVARNELQTELHKKISALEEELEALEAEAEDELEAKEKEMQVLADDLAGKDAKIAQLEAQQNQMCSSINDVSTSRQDDMEELQAELIAMTSRTTAQAREIQALKTKIEDTESRKGEYEKKLKSRINELEEEIADVTRNVRSQDVENLRGENNKLRDALREIKLERNNLKDRLDALASDKSNSKSAQVLRDRNIVLKEEVEKLTKRLKKMEASITRFAI
ncbi:hypothetical protein MPSEU_000276100 [Mayamaea pseudoterrestris]|nr:hypothetical protein MPSEU_000276100 [Mayamaea pseudoterrestris]